MKKMKYTIWGQMLGVVGTHAVTAFIFMFIWLITAGLWEGIAGKIFSGFGLVCYFIAIYNSGVSCAQADKRTISPLKAYPAKGFTLPIILLGVNIAIILAYKYAWGFGSDGEYLREGRAILLNVLTVLWTAPYGNILGMEKGVLEIQGYFILCILPFVATGAGYFAGYRGFDLFAKISSLAYEKKKSK